jgi:hypothetical protein
MVFVLPNPSAASYSVRDQPVGVLACVGGSIMSGRLRLLAVGVVGTLGLSLFTAVAANATVATTAASWTPNVVSTNAIVRQLVQCGNTMYAVGQFTKITQGGKSYGRNNAFSFDATTGAVNKWNPNVNGTVNSVALDPTCATVYLGGKYTTIGTTTAKNFGAVNATTGALITTIAHSAGGMVQTLLMVNGGQDLMVGGTFPSINNTAKAYYASLTPSTGKVNSYFSAVVAGKLPGDAASSMVYNQQLSPQGDKLLFEGDFLTIDGVSHLQAAELDLTATGATLDPWSNSVMNTTTCNTNEEFYEQAGSFSPDEQTIYLAATGYHGSSPYCDAVSAFANTAAATNLWINKTGGDSLFAVAASATDVYIAGHERWANNPFGSDFCGPGCLSRPGLGDIDPTTGQATDWNPTRDRGQGADDLLITGAGLWVASDTYLNSVNCAGVKHPGICFLPGTA